MTVRPTHGGKQWVGVAANTHQLRLADSGRLLSNRIILVGIADSCGPADLIISIQSKIHFIFIL